MDSLPRIPTPLAQRWREFRVQFLPLIVFSCIVGVIVVVWRQSGLTGHMTGVAEGVRSVVTSPQVASIEQLRVQPYQVVQAGDPIAILLPRDPGALLGLLQSELQIARLRFQPSVADRNVMNFEQIRVDLLQNKTELAMAKVNLARSENEVRRNTPLFKEKLVSEDIWDISVKTRDMYQAEVTAKGEAVAEIERRMKELQPLASPSVASSPTIDPLQEVLSRLEQTQRTVATNWGPFVLRAPISGMVSIVYRREGEFVVDGEPILVINSQWADRIVGYLRQPYAMDPQVGMSVHVATREYKSRNFWSEISQVGAQMETITNSLAFIRQGSLVDAGLPVVVEIPKGMKIRPGEAVDLVFRSRPTDLPPTIDPVGSKSTHQTAELLTP
ncbi:MAG TPA: hypothetical protein VJS65_16770 [Verrucomicrobiae bacterium]|nr:hypothetical protein [Verrucomicrobiae bacterium]